MCFIVHVWKFFCIKFPCFTSLSLSLFAAFDPQAPALGGHQVTPPPPPLRHAINCIIHIKVIKVGVLKEWIMISFCQEMAFVAAISQVKNCNKIEKTNFFAHVYQDFGLQLTLSQPGGQIMPTTALWVLSCSHSP